MTSKDEIAFIVGFRSTQPNLQPPVSSIKKPNCIVFSENAVYGLVGYNSPPGHLIRAEPCEIRECFSFTRFWSWAFLYMRFSNLPLVQALPIDVGLLHSDIADVDRVHCGGVVAEHHHVGTLFRLQ